MSFFPGAETQYLLKELNKKNAGETILVGGDAKEVARVLDATQGRYYRAQPGCIHYMHGVAGGEHEDLALAILHAVSITGQILQRLRLQQMKMLLKQFHLFR